MRSSVLFVTAALACAAGCSQRQPMVYVLDGPQEVKLVSSASATQVKRGETVVLHLERRITGNWKQIPRDQLTPGQCWLYTPPPQLEQEAADNVEWVVEPEDAVRFNAEFRMDHTRIAMMMVPGQITLTPFTAVRCEKDRVEQGPAIQIEVT
jgi:hypothetical protein